MRASTPECLLIILAACELSLSSAFLLATDNGAPDALNRVCATLPWLLSCSFAIMFSSLVVKFWRVVRIFDSKHVRVKLVSPGQIRLLIVALSSPAVLVCAVWTAVDPLRASAVRSLALPTALIVLAVGCGCGCAEWTISVLDTDADGFVTNQVGQCASDHSAYFIWVLLGYSALLVCPLESSLLVLSLLLTADDHWQSLWLPHAPHSCAVHA